MNSISLSLSPPLVSEKPSLLLDLLYGMKTCCTFTSTMAFRYTILVDAKNDMGMTVWFVSAHTCSDCGIHSHFFLLTYYCYHYRQQTKTY